MSGNETMPKICDGLLLPLTDESGWPLEFRAFIYLVGLLWSFMGVAIVADVFMCAIEVITSRVQTVKRSNPDAPDGVDELEIRVWNDTVANLTLMALGSSAPEILLSIIEIAGNGWESGNLGPSTIVGSAAFNLLVITAVCVAGIPDGESRGIKRIKVFATTALFSLFAYAWLFIVLIIITPDVVDIWEAVFTFMCFPILVVVAYMFDRDFCGIKKHEGDMELGVGRYINRGLVKYLSANGVRVLIIPECVVSGKVFPKDHTIITYYITTTGSEICHV